MCGHSITGQPSPLYLAELVEPTYVLGLSIQRICDLSLFNQKFKKKLLSVYRDNLHRSTSVNIDAFYHQPVCETDV